MKISMEKRKREMTGGMKLDAYCDGERVNRISLISYRQKKFFGYICSVNNLLFFDKTYIKNHNDSNERQFQPNTSCTT